MPSDQSTWIISVPQDGDSEGLLEELGSKLLQQSKTFSPSNIGQLSIPSFKVLPAYRLLTPPTHAIIDRDARLAHLSLGGFTEIRCQFHRRYR